MPISGLHIEDVGPFVRADFDFDPHVNVFVGPNNCGKSTVLYVLAEIAVVGFVTPKALHRIKNPKFRLQFIAHGAERHRISGSLPITLDGARWKGKRAKRVIAFQDSMGHIAFVPALRWSTGYRSKGPVRGRKETPAYEGSPTLIRDDTVIQEIVELDYRGYRMKSHAMRNLVSSIVSIVSEITEGFPMQFAGIAEDDDGLYLEFDTPDRRVPLEVLSQGTQSLFQWLARLLIGFSKRHEFPTKIGKQPGILIIDEIDAHLHPTWQRRILPVVSSHFPGLQIFCSTHSPLMLAGLKAGQIHLLKRETDGGILVSRNESDIIGWSADEIMTSLLGVEAATDLQTQQNLQDLQRLRQKKRLSAKDRKDLDKLRKSVRKSLSRGPVIDEADALAERFQQFVSSKGSRTRKKGRLRPAGRAATRVMKRGDN